MKATGIVRQVDQLGRVVLPMELRKQFGIKHNAGLEICIEGDMIILQKDEPKCIFCGSVEKVMKYKGKNICQDCIHKIKLNNRF